MLQEIKGSGNVAILLLRKEKLVKKLRRMCICLLIASSLVCNSYTAVASTDTKSDRTKQIVDICRNNYCIYGVFPSVCLAQAILESSLGDVCNSYNYWGLNQGKSYYASLEDGVYAYLECINNGYYGAAPHATNYADQLYSIARGGYCGGNWYWYWQTCMSIIEQNALWIYDQKLPKVSSIGTSSKKAKISSSICIIGK